MVRPIKIKNIEDIEKINSIVTKYHFDIWIHGKSGMADAKSILGMFILKLNEPLTLVVPDDVETSKLFKELGEYIEIY
ncbi:HPr family phosphocarrier protein [Ruminiclostridium herbifermentans]|uniref:HPr family phosphocarrier protein n=1 Tax=Ruminiclostridium herbifermentans TaxID=2488810 RepID=A0A4V6EPP8_9FIRM|nr:HPr family phosphocarrier protein [Ruminiclostridium herbifermentans]QNU67412.1 HPr family phosphocarrier protein [Ruminiclostridium herbifermentans]